MVNKGPDLNGTMKLVHSQTLYKQSSDETQAAISPTWSRHNLT